MKNLNLTITKCEVFSNLQFYRFDKVPTLLWDAVFLHISRLKYLCKK